MRSASNFRTVTSVPCCSTAANTALRSVSSSLGPQDESWSFFERGNDAAGDLIDPSRIVADEWIEVDVLIATCNVEVNHVLVRQLGTKARSDSARSPRGSTTPTPSPCCMSLATIDWMSVVLPFQSCPRYSRACGGLPIQSRIREYPCGIECDRWVHSPLLLPSKALRVLRVP